MLVLRRRHFLIMISCLVISFSAYYLNNSNTTNRTYEVTQVSSLPVHEKVIIIDAGHGGEDGRSFFCFWYE